MAQGRSPVMTEEPRHRQIDVRIDERIGRRQGDSALRKGLERGHDQQAAPHPHFVKPADVHRNHDHVVAARPPKPRGVADAAVCMAMVARGNPRFRFEVEPEPDGGVLDQVLANRQIGDDRRPERGEFRRAANSRPVEHSGGVNGARGEDDFPSLIVTDAVGRHRAYAARPPSVEFHPIDDHPAADRQVGSPAGRFEVRLVGRDSLAVAAVDRVRRDASAVGGVVIGRPVAAKVERRLP